LAKRKASRDIRVSYKDVAANRIEIKPAKSTRPAIIAPVVCLAVLLPFAAGIRLADGPVMVYHPHAANAAESPITVRSGATPSQAFSGPFYGLDPGNYNAVFEVRQGRQAASGPVARLEIVLYSSAGVTSITGDVPGHPTAPGDNGYEALAFTVTTRSNVETRVFNYGSADLSLGEVSVWPQTYRAPDEARAIAWIGSLVGILVLAGLWLGFRGPRAPKLRRTAGLISVCYFSVLSGWVVNILISTSPDGIGAPISDPLLPVIFWIPALLLGGLAINAFLHDPSHVQMPFLLAGQIACGPAVLLALGLASWSANWTSLSSVALALWAAEIWLALALFSQDSCKLSPTRSWAIAAYVFVGLFLWYEQYPLSGDQGSYLTETAALASHQTSNVLPVLDSGEFRAFAPYTSVAALRGDTVSVDGVSGYPARDLGLSALSVPGYLLGGLKGARIEMEILAAILAGLVFELVQRTGVRHSVAVFAWAVTCFSLPLLHYSSQIFPELAGAILTTLAMLQLRANLTLKCAVIAGICASLLPLFSVRYWLLTISILIVAGIRLRRDLFSAKGLALVLPVIVSTGVAILVNMSIYHLPLPNAGYFMVFLSGANPGIYVKSATGPFSRHFYDGWFGLWLDRNWGLFSTAPIFMLVPAGILALWKRARVSAIQILVIGIPYFLVVASTSFWQGGPTATPRFLVPLIPLMAVPVAAVLEEYWSFRVRILAGFLAAVGSLTAAAAIVSLDSDYVSARLIAYFKDTYGFTFSAALPPIETLSGSGFMLSVAAWMLLIVAFPLVVIWLHPRSRHS
jgi:hypothetical protein